MDLCEEGKLIVAREGNICVNKNGDVTNLYWHIYYCDKCAELRTNNLGKELRWQD